MLIFFREISLEEGFEVLKQQKHSRLVGGKQVSACSGWALFSSLESQPIVCWECGCKADRWIADKGQNDKIGHPVLNLYGTREGRLVLMNRDHIIPKSLGGTDDVQNLRPACEVCNGTRGNALDAGDLAFRAANPHLVCPTRLEAGRKKMLKAVKRHSTQDEKDKLMAPFRAIAEL